MIEFFFLILSLGLSYLIIFKSFSISETLNLYKINSKTKSIINRTPLTGGIIIFFSLLISIIYFFFFNYQYLINNFFIFFGILCVFCVGFLDDVFNLKYYKRLLLIFLILVIIFYQTPEITLKTIYFETFKTTFALESYSIFFSAFFILLLINAMNMSDGINGNAATIFLIFFFLLFDSRNQFNYSLFFIIPSLILFLFYNLKNKLYLGDSGVYLLSTFLAFYTISSYNYNNDNYDLSAEKIFLIFMIPGIDMFRLFVERILKNKSPFLGDLNHLHHQLKKKNTLTKTIIIYAALILWPKIFLNVIDPYKLIIANIILYLTILHFLKKLNKFS